MSATPQMPPPNLETSENITLFFDTHAEPKAQFQAIDHWCREYEARNRDWPTLAKLCVEVKRKELWKHGGFHSYDHWLHDAAPTCASTIYAAVSVYEKLSDDFSHEELRAMPSETAKVMTKVSTARRRDPEIREASKKKKKEFVKTVRAVAPEQELEGEDVRKFNFTPSQATRIDEALECFRAMNNPEMPDEEIVEYLCQFWMEAKWDGEEDTPYSNEQRARQLIALEES